MKIKVSPPPPPKKRKNKQQQKKKQFVFCVLITGLGRLTFIPVVMGHVQTWLLHDNISHLVSRIMRLT